MDPEVTQFIPVDIMFDHQAEGTVAVLIGVSGQPIVTGIAKLSPLDDADRQEGELVSAARAYLKLAHGLMAGASAREKEIVEMKRAAKKAVRQQADRARHARHAVKWGTHLDRLHFWAMSDLQTSKEIETQARRGNE